jgi:hypothetical protein
MMANLPARCLVLICLAGCSATQPDPANVQDIAAVSLSVSPASQRIDVPGGVQPAPLTFHLRNGGSRRAAFSVLCSDSANAVPGLGTIDSGGTVAVSVTLAPWWWPGLHAVACFAHGQGSSKEPIYTVLANVAAQPDGGEPDAGSDAGSWDAGSSDAGSWDAGSSDAGSSDAGSWDAGSWDAGSSDAGTRDGGH